MFISLGLMKYPSPVYLYSETKRQHKADGHRCHEPRHTPAKSNFLPMCWHLRASRTTAIMQQVPRLLRCIGSALEAATASATAAGPRCAGAASTSAPAAAVSQGACIKMNVKKCFDLTWIPILLQTLQGSVTMVELRPVNGMPIWVCNKQEEGGCRCDVCWPSSAGHMSPVHRGPRS
jgi:hypothetical protein